MIYKKKYFVRSAEGDPKDRPNGQPLRTATTTDRASRERKRPENAGLQPPVAYAPGSPVVLGAFTRHGFTIVELMVSMALMIYIMAILAEAFTAGLDAFHQLKAIGDMQERLRTASITLRRDLNADHFFPEIRSATAVGPRLSDQDLQTLPPPPSTSGGGGFFRILQGSSQGSANYVNEGVDADGIPSFRATDHILHFTIHLNDNRPEDYFACQVPAGLPPGLDTMGGSSSNSNPVDMQSPGTYHSQWAEVAYFLRPTIAVDGTPLLAGTTPLFALYRRQRLLIPNGDNASINNGTTPYSKVSETSPPSYFEMSTQSGTNPLHFNSPSDVTMPEYRFAANPAAGSGGIPATGPGGAYPMLSELAVPSPAQAGDDLLLADVLSFQVQILYDFVDDSGTPHLGQDFQDLPTPATTAWPSTKSTGLNSVFSAAGVRVFDTWSQSGAYSAWATAGTGNSLPSKIKVRALQITIRVWDSKSKTARQMTLVQNM